MAYSIDRAFLLADQLERFAHANVHQVAGQVANVEFWLDEAVHVLRTIDDYPQRFRRLRGAQVAWVEAHGTKVSGYCPVCQGGCELGILSVMAHGNTEHAETIAGVMLPVIGGLDEERLRFYLDLLLNSVNEATRRVLEAMMKGYEYQSDFAKKYFAQGRSEGRNEGHREGEARALLTVLGGRGIAVPDPARERILAEKDPARLERWLAKAAVASSLADVLDEPS